MLTGFSALAGLAVALGLPESMPASMPRQPLSGAFRQYARLLSDRVYLGHALTGGIAIDNHGTPLPPSTIAGCEAAEMPLMIGMPSTITRLSPAR